MVRMIGKRRGVTIKERNQLAQDYLPIVRRIARGLSCKAPQSVTVEDLVSAGLIGLMDAAGRYDPTQEEKFGSFVATRVRGAMLDELRANDPLTRDLRAKSNSVVKAMNTLFQQLGRQPEEEEIAECLSLSLPQYQALLMQLQQATFLSPASIEQAIAASKGYPDRIPGNPQDDYLFAELQERLAKAIKSLPHKEQQILSMYYNDEKSLHEIGDAFGVTDSRACQLRSQAIVRLRTILSRDIG